jgi:hypothetical protein
MARNALVLKFRASLRDASLHSMQTSQHANGSIRNTQSAQRMQRLSPTAAICAAMTATSAAVH